MVSEFVCLVFLSIVFSCKFVMNVIINESPPIELEDDLLPSSIEPLRYDITISSDIDPEDSTPFYEGDVLIKIHCSSNLWYFTLNQAGFRLLTGDIKIQLLAANGKPTRQFLIITNQEHLTGDRLKVHVRTPLEANKSYEIAIKFSKILFISAEAGYILRSYRKHYTFAKYMVFTKLNEFDAHRVIPCLDQISMKSKFKVWLKYRKGLTAFSSAPFQNRHQIPTNLGWIKDEFYETENMSTFSLAIAIAEFQSTGFSYATKVNVQTWGIASIMPDAGRINGMVSRIFAHFSELFKLPHPSGKLDVLILPEVDFEIHESFGIIFMSDTYVQETLRKNSNPATIQMLTKLCHAVSYQWIGNTVTMHRWEDNWWLQGLNSFLQIECVKNVFKEYPSNILEMNQIESFTMFLRNEEIHEYEPISILKSYPNYHPMSNLTEERLHHFIRMIYFILGPSLFNTRLAKYLDDYKHKNSKLTDALAAFSDKPRTNVPNILPVSYSIRKIMESWLNEPGTPLLRVEISRAAKSVTVKQEDYNSLYVNAILYPRREKCWLIPLSYTTKKELKFDEITLRAWSGCDGAIQFPIGDLDQDDWVLINLEFNVPGRVMYNLENWIAIQNSLLDLEDHKKISVLTRARVLCDMFSLAEAGILSYEIVFKTMAYLKHEEEYAVWNVAFKEIDKLRILLLRTDLFEMYQTLVRTILEHVFAKRKFKYLQEVPKGNEVESNFEVSLMESSCKFGVQGCNEKCSSLFKMWLSSHGLGKKLNMRHSIYKLVMCERIKDGNEKFFEDFWKPSLETPLENVTPGSREDLLEAFACSQKKETLEKLLKKSISNEITSLESVNIFRFLSSNDNGYKLMMEFYLKNYNKIKSFHSNGETSDLSYLEILFDATNNDADLNTLSTFASKEKLILSSKSMRKSMRNALRNADWSKTNMNNFKKVFKDLNLQLKPKSSSKRKK